MTAPTAVEEVVEQRKKLPPIKHAHCTLCQCGPGEIVALCGNKKTIAAPVPLVGPLIPPHACVVCADLLMDPCELCGRSAWR